VIVHFIEAFVLFCTYNYLW